MGCKLHYIEFQGRKINPIKDLKLLYNYYNTINKISPNVILTYTIRPNIYGGIAAKILRRDCVPNIARLGTALANKSRFQPIIKRLYSFGISSSKVIFFQNKGDLEFFEKNNIAKKPKRNLYLILV